MTTIAWDGKTLAADKQTTHGGTPSLTTKVYEAISPEGKRWIYACSGRTDECQEFTRRVSAGREMPAFSDINVLAIDHHGQVWMFHGTFWERKHVQQWAAGSGADYALGAMAAGADARRAVEIASTLDINTGIDGGIDVLTL